MIHTDEFYGTFCCSVRYVVVHSGDGPVNMLTPDRNDCPRCKKRVPCQLPLGEFPCEWYWFRIRHCRNTYRNVLFTNKGVCLITENKIVWFDALALFLSTIDCVRRET